MKSVMTCIDRRDQHGNHLSPCRRQFRPASHQRLIKPDMTLQAGRIQPVHLQNVVDVPSRFTIPIVHRSKLGRRFAFLNVSNERHAKDSIATRFESTVCQNNADPPTPFRYWVLYPKLGEFMRKRMEDLQWVKRARMFLAAGYGVTEWLGKPWHAERGELKLAGAGERKSSRMQGRLVSPLASRLKRETRSGSHVIASGSI